MALIRDPHALGDDWRPFLNTPEDPKVPWPWAEGTQKCTWPPSCVIVHGPRGCGTSTYASSLARLARGRWQARPSRRPPVTLTVDLRIHRSGHQIIGALYHALDPSFDARGCSTEHLTLLFLRRLRTEGRPSVIWFDNMPGRPGDLFRVLRPILSPHDLLPEGLDDHPGYVVLVSGETDSARELRAGCAPTESVRLGAPDYETLRASLTRRATAAFQRTPPSGVITKMTDMLAAAGGGYSREGELLRAAAHNAEGRRAEVLTVEDVHPLTPDPLHLGDPARLDACVLASLRDLEEASQGVAIARLRGRLHTVCLEEGLPVPNASRLWRRVVRLETAGYLHREVRLGGAGGTQTRLHLGPTPPSAAAPMGVGAR